MKVFLDFPLWIWYKITSNNFLKTFTWQSGSFVVYGSTSIYWYYHLLPWSLIVRQFKRFRHCNNSNLGFPIWFWKWNLKIHLDFWFGILIWNFDLDFSFGILVLIWARFHFWISPAPIPLWKPLFYSIINGTLFLYFFWYFLYNSF